MAIFNYLNDENLQNLLGNIHDGIGAAAAEFDTVYNTFGEFPPAEQTNIHGLWTTFINYWTQRLTNRFRNALTIGINGNEARMTQLAAAWNNILDNNPTPQQMLEGGQAIQAINDLNDEIAATVIFNRSPFT